MTAVNIIAPIVSLAAATLNLTFYLTTGNPINLVAAVLCTLALSVNLLISWRSLR